MVLKIDGIDMMPYIVQNGIKWSRNDVDGANAGRTMDATMHRQRVAEKARLDVTCLPLPSEHAAIVLNAIRPEYFEVEYMDPMDGLSIKTMYCSTVPATYVDTDTDLWNGIAFALIER